MVPYKLSFFSENRKSKMIMRINLTYNVGPNRKFFSHLFLSETVETFVGKFGSALGGSL
jgi:uncharacterized protein involved in tellurium resistance